MERNGNIKHNDNSDNSDNDKDNLNDKDNIVSLIPSYVFTSYLNLFKQIFLFIEFGENIFVQDSFVDVYQGSEYAFEYV